jgi:prepilin-type N-terminal cleavage/methylation domain-containing protein
MRSARGFTLLECIVVIVLVSASLLGVANLYSTAVRALTASDDLQAVSQFAQACAEEVLAAHRKTNLAAASTVPALCTGVRTGYARTLTVSAPYLNQTTQPWCPSRVTCRDVAIEVTGTRSTDLRARVDLMLATY